SGCYIFDNNIIVGDTLFRDSYGRTDLPTGNDYEMIESIRKLKNLDGDYNVFPGHGLFTTLNREREYNPLMSRV
ncbi:MAG: MBL fold metallo-hydrolase, partial [Ruminococcus sp.]|nr:MBL fold metallo-hydrolase [Ruminococcus sp.]